MCEFKSLAAYKDVGCNLAERRDKSFPLCDPGKHVVCVVVSHCRAALLLSLHG